MAIKFGISSQESTLIDSANLKKKNDIQIEENTCVLKYFLRFQTFINRCSQYYRTPEPPRLHIFPIYFGIHVHKMRMKVLHQYKVTIPNSNRTITD